MSRLFRATHSTLAFLGKVKNRVSSFFSNDDDDDYNDTSFFEPEPVEDFDEGITDSFNEPIPVHEPMVDELDVNQGIVDHDDQPDYIKSLLGDTPVIEDAPVIEDDDFYISDEHEQLEQLGHDFRSIDDELELAESLGVSRKDLLKSFDDYEIEQLIQELKEEKKANLEEQEEDDPKPRPEEEEWLEQLDSFRDDTILSIIDKFILSDQEAQLLKGIDDSFIIFLDEIELNEDNPNVNNQDYRLLQSNSFNQLLRGLTSLREKSVYYDIFEYFMEIDYNTGTYNFYYLLK